MFFPPQNSSVEESTSFITAIEVDAYLEGYKKLNPALIKGDDDGLACRFKFSNNNKGVVLATRLKIENLALALMNETYDVAPENVVSYMDMLVLSANHIDQHTNHSENEKIAPEEKKRLVLLFLDAAFKLNEKMLQNEFSIENARLLSSQVLLFHYLGKAERYSLEPARQDSANRIVKLDKALTIAEFLSESELTDDQHPHNYGGLLSTCRLVKGYCLKDLGCFEEALALQQFDINTGNNFHKTQSLKESCKIITLQLNNPSITPETKEALETQLISYAKQSVELSLEQNSETVRRNAENALMHAYDSIGNEEAAKDMANRTLALESDNESGIKDYHLNEARAVIEKYESAPVASMGR